eukprot:ctg_235.g143
MATRSGAATYRHVRDTIPRFRHVTFAPLAAPAMGALGQVGAAHVSVFLQSATYRSSALPHAGATDPGCAVAAASGEFPTEVRTGGALGAWQQRLRSAEDVFTRHAFQAVRHDHLRAGPHQGQIQVLLLSVAAAQDQAVDRGGGVGDRGAGAQHHAREELHRVAAVSVAHRAGEYAEGGASDVGGCGGGVYLPGHGRAAPGALRIDPDPAGARDAEQPVQASGDATDDRSAHPVPAAAQAAEGVQQGAANDVQSQAAGHDHHQVSGRMWVGVRAMPPRC